MQLHLRPDLLRAAGVADFDVWAATFGQTVTEIEMAPQGGWSFRQATRFSNFQNFPKMPRVWHVFADVKTAEDLALPTTELSGRPDGVRGPHTVIIEPAEHVRAYVTRLGERAETVKSRGVDPTEDNMLKIVADGRKGALHMRLVSDHATGGRASSRAPQRPRCARYPIPGRHIPRHLTGTRVRGPKSGAST